MTRMDKTKGGFYKRGQEPSDVSYWRSRPPIERLIALEEIRREYNHWKYGTKPILQRVYRIIKRKKG